MNDRDAKEQEAQDVEKPQEHIETLIGPSRREQTEIEGWALQWDTYALRKVSLARRMRDMRKPSDER